jgi:RNA-directed DNA polymerase
MTTTPISLQDLRRRLYAKAKAESSWRFWGLYVHICKGETLREAYLVAKQNGGAPGIDGLTFEAIEANGLDGYLQQIRDELVTRQYRPMRNRRKEIPKEGGKVRVLGIPTIRDRVVQGALKLILEPIFEADFQDGSYGYRSGKTAHAAIDRVDAAIMGSRTRVIDLDLKSYFDNVRHHILLEKVARRVQDAHVMHLVKLILTANGKKGVPQGGVISPLLSNIYLSDIDVMLEKAKEVTRSGQYANMEYARFADDLVVLVNPHAPRSGLLELVDTRLREELGKLQVEVNEEKSRIVDLETGGVFSFLGYDFRRVRSRSGKWRAHRTPRMKKRTALLREVTEIFRRHRSQPIQRVIAEINPKIKGWVNYFAYGNSSRCLGYIRDWTEKKVRRHLTRNSKRTGFGWKRWSRRWLHHSLGLFKDYRVSYNRPRQTALPIRWAT